VPESPEEPKWGWKLPSAAPASAPTPHRALPPADDFRRTVAFTVAGTVLPGLGLIAARRKVIGWIILGLFLACLLAIGGYAAYDRNAFLGTFVKPNLLRIIMVVLPVVAVVWVGVIVASHLSLRGQITKAQRIGGGILVAALAFAVAAPMAVAARFSYDTANSVNTIFKSETQSKSATRPTLNVKPSKAGQTTAQDPWAAKPRLNILLLGGDAGADRTGTRTDTVILASIDTHTGNTTLFSLPRNTGRMPFPSDSPLKKYYPHGFTNGDGNNAEYFLNAMYDNVPRNVPKNVLGPTDNLGADALKLSVGEALGLPVDYYVLINLKGFSTLIDALGGITVNINTYIPIGGNTDLHIPPKEFIHPGANQKLDGRSALWYARGRYGADDFVRMDRQRCVINAMIKQANPANVLTRYEDIANASKSVVYTDMPQEVLPAMVDLSLRVKNGSVRSVVFKHGEKGFLSPDPDFPLMRKQVKKALGESKSDSSEGKSSSKSSGTDSSKTTSEDVDSSCKYDPKVAATARPYTG
jgi:LCP family protein required for cell wall assembly